MNWIKENKFLAGFFGVMIAGIAALSYYLFSTWGGYARVSETYTREAGELKRLQGLTPYPDAENLKKLKDQKDAYVSAIARMRANLSAIEFPLEPMEPAAFQDNLRKSVSAAMEKAQKNGVQLPKEKFYMGFDVYQTTPPKDAKAAAALGRQLKSIELVVGTLIDSKVDSITSVGRTPLPEEADVKSSTPQPGAMGAAAPGAQKPPLVSKFPFSVAFVAEQGRARKALNEIASSKSQFLVLNAVQIKNENLKGPSRIEGAAPVAETPVASGTSSGIAAPGALKFVVGTEKLNILASIDMVDFAEPTKK